MNYEVSEPRFYRLVEDESPAWKADGDITLRDGRKIRPAKDVTNLWMERAKLCTALQMTATGDAAFELAQNLIDQMCAHQERLLLLHEQLNGKVAIVDSVEKVLGGIIDDLLEKCKLRRDLSRRQKAELKRLRERLITKGEIIGAQRRALRKARKGK